MMIDAYEPGIEFKNFPNLEEQMNHYFDRIYDTGGDPCITPRYYLQSGLKTTQRDIFYYINRLYDNNPSSVVDVGCGECMWKLWFPNIIGFDNRINEFSQQDFVATFNRDFSQSHTKQYQCGMALNSIHFLPWEEISGRIHSAMNIVQDRFLFTFNFSVVANLPVPLPPSASGGEELKTLESLFDQIILNSGYKIILVDYPSQRPRSLIKNLNNDSRIRPGELEDHNFLPLNGHVRFILAHND